MRSLLMGAAMALAMAGAAAAQTPPSQGDQGQAGQGEGQTILLVPANGNDAAGGPAGGSPPAPPHPGMMGARAGWGPPGGAMGGPMGEHRGPMRAMMWRALHAQEGLSIHLRRGDNEIDVRCPANQPMKDCADAAGALLDKVGSMRGAGPGAAKP